MGEYFGENIREVVSASCGSDLRAARSRTRLPGIDSPEVQRRLISNLERNFDIRLSPGDSEHLTTLRAVLQCVRLRRWERDTQARDSQIAAAAPMQHTVPAASAAVSTWRERFVRYSPPTSAMPVPRTPSFAVRKS